MDTLSKEQQDILLDYYFECAGREEADTARDLLETHKGAVEFYNKLHHSLTALEHIDAEKHTSCPDHLVEKTLEKIYSHPDVSSGADDIEQLLANERIKYASADRIVTKRPSFWRSLAETAAAAAAVVILSGLFVPVTRQMRAQAWQTACQANLAKVSQGVSQYANDNQGYLPAVATKAGSPWWKIGSTEQENQSNTRHVWLLVKQGYVQPQVFVCPGFGNKNMPIIEKARIQTLSDFPDRRYISYSFKLISEPNKATLSRMQMPLMSDVNPIFESCLKNPCSSSKAEFDIVKLNEKLLRVNSSSHRGRGQNIMFSDGAVKFTSQRAFDQNDDIFTVQGQDTYRGTETPSSEKDVFLVP